MPSRRPADAGGPLGNRRVHRAAALGLAAVLAACLVGPASGLAQATFAAVETAGADFATAGCFPTDTTAPTVDATVIAKNAEHLTGYVRQGGTYRVYASVSDACGVATARADVSALTAGQTAVNLPAGTFTVGGVAYGRRSAALTVRNPLAEGTYAYTISATDPTGNSRTATGFTVVVDNTRPAGSGVQTANGGATIGRAEAGDSVSYTYSEIVDPQSVLAGWTGLPTPVVVRLTNNGGGDRLTIRNAANTSNLPLGTIMLAGNYVAASRVFGASGTPSTMSWTGGTIMVTLGTPSGAVLTSTTPGTMTWPPASTVTDRAGNTCQTTTVNESAALDVEF